MKLSNASTFQILINKFTSVKLAQLSFGHIEQADSSYFELNLANGNALTLSENAFAGLKQAYMSKFILFFNIVESSLCVPSNFLTNLSQSKNSTVRLTFLLNESNNLVFNRQALSNLKQSQHSFLQIYVLKSNNLVLNSQSVADLSQSKSSSFEVWASKGNFIIRAGALKNVTQGEYSSIRIGFTSESKSIFKQSPYALDNFSPHPTAEIVYDFAKGNIKSSVLYFMSLIQYF